MCHILISLLRLSPSLPYFLSALCIFLQYCNTSFLDPFFFFSSDLSDVGKQLCCHRLLINSEVQFLLIMKITLRGALILCSVTMTSKFFFCIIPEVSFFVPLLSIGRATRW